MVMNDMADDGKWGAEIAVYGVRPEWLGEEAVYQWRHEPETGWAVGIAPSKYEKVGAWDHIDFIRLPADHPRYQQAQTQGQALTAQERLERLERMEALIRQYASGNTEVRQRYRLSARLVKAIFE